MKLNRFGVFLFIFRFHHRFIINKYDYKVTQEKEENKRKTNAYRGPAINRVSRSQVSKSVHSTFYIYIYIFASNFHAGSCHSNNNINRWLTHGATSDRHDVIAASGAIIGGFGLGSAAMINALGLCITNLHTKGSNKATTKTHTYFWYVSSEQNRVRYSIEITGIRYILIW